jgi:hypothetical protein
MRSESRNLYFFLYWVKYFSTTFYGNMLWSQYTTNYNLQYYTVDTTYYSGNIRLFSTPI